MVQSSVDGPLAVIQRLHQAQNQHDIVAFVACFAADYASEQPNYPDRAFTGNAQVHKNWSAIFRDIPDFHADLIRASVSDQTGWSEWHWTGTHLDGSRFEWRGVIIMGIQGDKIGWARLYMAPVEQPAGGIDAAVKAMTRSTDQS